MRIPIALSLFALLGCGQPAPPLTQLEGCPECPAAGPPLAATTSPESAPAGRLADPEPRVTLGSCDTQWLPPGLVGDVDVAVTHALVDLVRSWVAGTGAPPIWVSRGIVFAKSMDDSGADPPLPKFAHQDSDLACGRDAVWLREYARSLLIGHLQPALVAGVRCMKNVCCYPAAGEGESSGTFVFAELPDDRLTLQAVAIVADNGTVHEAWIGEQRRWVAQQISARLQERCAGEPESVTW